MGGQGNLTVDMELGFSLQRMGFVLSFTALFGEGLCFVECNTLFFFLVKQQRKLQTSHRDQSRGYMPINVQTISIKYK